MLARRRVEGPGAITHIICSMSIVLITLQLSSSALQPSLPRSALLITISQVNVMSSFAVPFEEDERDPNVWFVDHNYIE